MTQLSLDLFPQNEDDSERDPHPLLVSYKWDFPLAHFDVDGNKDNYLYHAVQWTQGLGASSHTTWERLKIQLVNSVDRLVIEKLPFTADNGKEYLVDYIDQKTCYLVAQSMRVTKKRPQLQHILDYLAEQGVLADSEDRQPEKAVGRHLDKLAKNYQLQGKSDEWIQYRIQGTVSRKRFTDAIKAAVMNLEDSFYRDSTELVYKGLWERTTKQLRNELGVKRGQDTRDHFSELGLLYTQIAEHLCATKLEHAETVSMTTASDIIWQVAKIVKVQINDTRDYLGIDLVTGKPLLNSGKD